MRLFTGIAIPPTIRDAIADVVGELRKTASLHWSPAENLHITTKFIGPWPEERLGELKTVLAGAKTPGPFAVAIGRFGFFPNPHRPRTFFAGVHATEPFRALAKSLEGAMELVGVPAEAREYLPHVTLAKIQGEEIREMREWLAGKSAQEFGVFQAEEFHLYLSDNSKYIVLDSFRL